MKCPTCDLKGVVHETRPREEGVMRRYRCAAGHKWKTIEQLDLVYDESYVKELQVETGKRLVAPLVAAKQARLARGELTKAEIAAARRARALAFQASRVKP